MSCTRIRSENEVCFSELAEARSSGDDLASIRSDFVAAELEKFTRDVLNLGHAETEAHQFGAERPSRRRPAACRSRCAARGFDGASAPGMCRSGPGPCRRAFVAKETRMMPTVFPRQLSMPTLRPAANQFVHIAPPQPVLPDRSCATDLDLPITKYKRSAHAKRFSSIAPECCSNARVSADCQETALDYATAQWRRNLSDRSVWIRACR